MPGENENSKYNISCQIVLLCYINVVILISGTMNLLSSKIIIFFNLRFGINMSVL